MLRDGLWAMAQLHCSKRGSSQDMSSAQALLECLSEEIRKHKIKYTYGICLRIFSKSVFFLIFFEIKICFNF